MAVNASQTLEDFLDQFWEGVYLTLVVVFDTPAHLTKKYRFQFDRTPERRRMLAYNATPLQVAADLAQADTVTSEQQQVYHNQVFPYLVGIPDAGDDDRFLVRAWT